MHRSWGLAVLSLLTCILLIESPVHAGGSLEDVPANAYREVVLCDTAQPTFYPHAIYRPDLSDCDTCSAEDALMKESADQPGHQYAAIVSANKSALLRYPEGTKLIFESSIEVRDGVQQYCLSARMPAGMAWGSLAEEVQRRRGGRYSTNEMDPHSRYTCETMACTGRGCCPSRYCLVCLCGAGEAGCDGSWGFITDAQLRERRYF